MRGNVDTYYFLEYISLLIVSLVFIFPIAHHYNEIYNYQVNYKYYFSVVTFGIIINVRKVGPHLLISFVSEVMAMLAIGGLCYLNISYMLCLDYVNICLYTWIYGVCHATIVKYITHRFPDAAEYIDLFIYFDE